MTETVTQLARLWEAGQPYLGIFKKACTDAGVSPAAGTHILKSQCPSTIAISKILQSGHFRMRVSCGRYAHSEKSAL